VNASTIPSNPDVAALPPIAFIGGGNMAASLIGGLLAAGLAPNRVRVAQRGRDHADALRRRFGVEVVSRPVDAIQDRRLLVLAVKPQQMAEALKDLSPLAGCTVISVAAGLRVSTLAHWLPDCALVRAMPNTPALFNAGITGLYAPATIPAESRKLAQTVLVAAGPTCWVSSEDQMDAVTALSGCGPAYYFLLTEALREAGSSLGLAPDVAAQLAHQTFIGAAKMAQNSTEDVAVLRRQVTSRGGSTEAAIATLESFGLRRIFQEALKAAKDRSRLRADELESSIHA